MTDPRSLDALDPPSWDAAAPDATFLVRRCHELRRKPIEDVEVEDLRLMIGQSIGLRHLVPFALDRLEGDPLAEGDYFPGDLLLNVLRIDLSFWTTYPTLSVQLDGVLDAISPSSRLDAELSEQISAFRARGV